MKTFGTHTQLAIEWTRKDGAEADLLALGWSGLRLWVGSRLVWSGADGAPLEWTWIDLVEHLARAWGALLWEDTMPMGMTVVNPEAMRTLRVLKAHDRAMRAELERAVHAWQHRHDLASGLHGLVLPPVWVIPMGRRFRVRASGHEVQVERETLIAVLENFVEELFGSIASPAPRVAQAIDWWSQREPAGDRLLSLRTGLPLDVARELVPRGKHAGEWWGIDSAQDSPLMAAARYAGHLSTETLRVVLETIEQARPAETPVLDQLTEEAEALEPALAGLKRYEQGHFAAQWLRKRLVHLDLPLDPEALLAALAVPVHDMPAVDATLDAVAVWGDQHGPAIFLNPNGVHVSSPAGRSATLAHEVAHLLLDRGVHLPAAEVLGGSTPAAIEQRARAFAAEYLLPRDLVANDLADDTTREQNLKALPANYGVSRELAGWQVRNGDGWRHLNESQKAMVRKWCRSEADVDWRAS